MTINVEDEIQKARQTFSLHWTVDIVMPICRIRVLVVSHVVDLVLLEELWCYDPGSFRDNFVCPLAVTYVLTSVAPQGSFRGQSNPRPVVTHLSW